MHAATDAADATVDVTADATADAATDAAIDEAAPLQSSKHPIPAAKADAAAPALASKQRARATQLEGLGADESWTPPFHVDFEVRPHY